MAFKNILEGHYNEILNKNDEISKKRLSICKECPLFTTKWYGYVCDRNQWINPSTNEVTDYEKDNHIRGCGCRLDAKTRDEDSKCPINKW